MSIHNQDTIEIGKGFAKEIEESALPLILDNLQQYQYQYPIKSTVRELASNAYDSVQEKLAAVRILSGQARVEDYFIHRDDPMYRDSNWNPQYYDLSRLSPSNNEVLIRHLEGDVHDSLEVIDHGVGLGGKRLEGYFKLGWSSKRNTTLALGKFGIGAKVALSTGADFYTMETRYNGQLYRFNIYAHKVDPIIPRLNLETGQQNPYVWFNQTDTKGNPKPFEEWVKVHYLEGQGGHNYTRISFRVKKHHKQSYVQAVHSQLLYFPTVRFELVDRKGSVTASNPQASVLYEDDYLVVSNNTQFTKPHLVINKVCYGNIDWLELDFEDRGGNVALKVNMEDVTVNPSREAVIWNDKTRETVLKRIENAIHSAETIIQDELQTESLWDWMKTVVNLAVKRDDSVIGRLAQFSAASNFSPRYTLEGRRWKAPELIYLMKGLLRTTEIGELVRTSKKVKYNSMNILPSELFTLPVYFTREEHKTLRKRKYLCQLHGSRVVFLNLELVTFLDKALPSMAEDLEIPPNALLSVLSQLVLEIQSHCQDYDAVVVPEDFSLTEKEEEEQPEEEEQKIVKAKAARPEYSTLRWISGAQNSALPMPTYHTVSVEKGQGVRSLPHREVFIGTLNEDDSQMAALIGTLCAGNVDCMPAGNKFSGELVKIHQDLQPSRASQITYSPLLWGKAHGLVTGAVCVQVSQDIYRKSIDKYYTYQEFFLQIEANKIRMSHILSNWYTAQLIDGAVQKFRAFYHLQGVCPQLSEKYRQLYNHWTTYHVDLESQQWVSADKLQELMGFCNKVAVLQRATTAEDKDDAEVARLSRQLFGGEFAEAEAFNAGLVKIAEELEAYEPVLPLVNHLDFTHPDVSLPELKSQTVRSLVHETEVALREYFQFKNLDPA